MGYSGQHLEDYYCHELFDEAIRQIDTKQYGSYEKLVDKFLTLERYIALPRLEKEGFRE